MLVAEYRSVDLSFGGIFQALDLFFGFRGHVRFERLDVFFDASLHPLQQAYAVAVLAVSVFFRHCFLLKSSVLQTRGRVRPRHTVCYARRNDLSSLNWVG